MQLSLRPYVTTGVALVGATVIAAAPDATGHARRNTNPQPGGAGGARESN